MVTNEADVSPRRLSRTSPSRRRGARRRIMVTFAACWLAVLVVIALTVQWWPIHDFGTAVATPNTSPHWGAEFFGTDAAGRSMLSRLLYGARTSLTISVAATTVGFILGTTFGICAAYFGPPVSTIGEVIANTILAVPTLVLLLGIVLALGATIPNLIIVIGLAFIPQYLRLVKTEASRQLARDYVLAARSLGATSKRIIFREVVPNTLPSLAAYTVLVLSAVMIIEGGLSFLGYGVQSPTPSWGNMIALGNQYVTSSPWQSLLPCIFFALTIFSLITLGDHLRERLAAGGPSEA